MLDESVSKTAPSATTPRAKRDSYKKHVDDALEVFCIKQSTMDFEPQKQHENMDVFDMIKHLKTLYQEQARDERFDVTSYHDPSPN